MVPRINNRRVQIITDENLNLGEIFAKLKKLKKSSGMLRFLYYKK